MKTALFVTPCFLPENHIAVRRPAGLAKYLKEFGWEVTVLTLCKPGHVQNPISQGEMEEQAGLDESRVIRVARIVPPLSKNLLLKALRGVAEYWVLPGSDNRRSARLALEKTAAMDLKADVIWATAPGYGMFLIAAGLARRLGVSWVADFRDIAEKFVVYPRWVRRVMAWREAQFCRSAAHITTIEPNADILARRHRAPISFISNGFDPHYLCEAPERPRGHTFRIVYTGSLHGRQQDLRPIIRAANELVAERAIPRDEIKLEFYGFVGRRARRAWRTSVTSDGVQCLVMGWLPWGETLRVQKEATVLLLLGAAAIPFFLPGKLFEYMVAGRPVLAWPKVPKGIDPILKTTGIGVSCNSTGELKAAILRWYQEWKQTGDIHMDRDHGEIMKWSRRGQAGALAAVLDGVIRPKR